MRAGRKGQPKFKVVVAEQARAVKGKFQKKLGVYDPHTKALEVDKEAVVELIGHGAQPTTTVARIFQKAGMKDMEKFIKRADYKKKEEAPAA